MPESFDLMMYGDSCVRQQPWPHPHGRRVYRIRRRRTPRATAPRGQAIVEFALAIPIFLAFLFGTLEMGMLFKTRAAYQQAAQQAARVDAIVGGTDADALSQIRTMLPVENLNAISSITVYDATLSAAVPVTSTMKTVYQYNGGTNSFTVSGSSSWTQRNTTVGSVDRLGVQIAFRYNSVLGLFASIPMTATAIVEMEPTTY